jgi:hypothetical protein
LQSEIGFLLWIADIRRACYEWTLMKHAHKVGRPLRSVNATSNITLRLTDEERLSVEAHVEKTGKPRAVLIREAMEAFGLFTLPRKRS